MAGGSMSSTSARNPVPRLADPMAGGPLARFARGFSFVPRGMGLLLANRRYWGLAAVPVLLTLVLLTLATWGAVKLSPLVLSTLWALPDSSSPLYYLAAVAWYGAAFLLGVLVFAVGAVAAYAGVGLLATPFNDLLSERVEAALLEAVDEPFRLRVFLADTATSLGHSLLDLLAWALSMLVMSLLNTLPVVGTPLFTAAGWASTALFLAKDMLDGPMTRRRFTYREKLGVLGLDLFLCAGFGAAVSLLLLVPVLNLFLVPVAVAGGTAMYCHMEANGRIPFPDRRRDGSRRRGGELDSP